MSYSKVIKSCSCHGEVTGLSYSYKEELFVRMELPKQINIKKAMRYLKAEAGMTHSLNVSN